jgi:hypothetical protein
VAKKYNDLIKILSDYEPKKEMAFSAKPLKKKLKMNDETVSEISRMNATRNRMAQTNNQYGKNKSSNGSQFKK